MTLRQPPIGIGAKSSGILPADERIAIRAVICMTAFLFERQLLIHLQKGYDLHENNC